MALIPILFEREASPESAQRRGRRAEARSNPRNGAGAHLRFGHKAMIASDHRVLVSGPDATQTRGGKKKGNFFTPIARNPLKSPDSEK